LRPLTPSEIPVTLRGQLRRHMPAYVLGAVVLGTFQLAMNRIDWLSKAAVDLIFGGRPAEAMRPVLFILGLALLAFVSRVASRWFIFNAGRDVEYELRQLLLHRLHKLGAAFYRTMSSGEIMSRSSSASASSTSSTSSSRSPAPSRSWCASPASSRWRRW
jgi:ATP-binding cassette subfamily B multidrug efflux pump